MKTHKGGATNAQESQSDVLTKMAKCTACIRAPRTYSASGPRKEELCERDFYSLGPYSISSTIMSRPK